MTQASWLEDKLAIHELCARYTLTIDAHDIDAWARTFTEDGLFGFGDNALRGRDSIIEYGQVHRTLGTRHMNTSLLYEVDPGGRTAKGKSSVAMVLLTKKGYRVGFCGHYVDELRKVDGEWLFSSRWVVAETLPDDQGFDVVSADPDVISLVQRLLDAYERLGVPTPAPDSARL
jgi:hypothetical protein